MDQEWILASMAAEQQQDCGLKTERVSYSIAQKAQASILAL